MKPVGVHAQRRCCSPAPGQSQPRDTESIRPLPWPLVSSSVGTPIRPAVFPQIYTGFQQNTQPPQMLPIKYRNYINNINILSYILAI